MAATLLALLGDDLVTPERPASKARDMRDQKIYRVSMGASMSPEEIRAAAEVHDELDPRYRDAVIESFLDKVGREIDARVDARLARQAPAPAPHAGRRGHQFSGSPMTLAIASLVFGIPISAIAAAAGAHPAGLLGLLVVWLAIAVINVAYNISYAARYRQPPDSR